MAITVDELKYILTLDPARMRAELQKIDKRVEQTRGKTEKPLKVNIDIRGITAGFAQVGLALQGFRTIQQTLQQPLADANRAYLEQEKSIRKIEAASKLTGVSLQLLRNISNNIENDFKLTTQQANEFTTAANRLTAAAGATEKTEIVLRKLFDLAAGQGLNASEALLRFEQAIKGVDEGTEALFSGKNPIDLYKEYAAQIGTTAGKMDDMQKKQAIVNAILSDGAKLQGEYNAFLESAAGQQSQLAANTEQLKAALGDILNDVYKPILQIVGPLVKALGDMDAGYRNAAIAATVFFAIGSRIPALLNAINLSIKGITRSTGIGLLVTLLTTAAGAFTAYEASAEGANDAMIRQRLEFEKLLRALIGYNNRQKLSNDEQARKQSIIEELNRKYPDYLKNVNLETASNKELYTAINRSNEALQQRIRTLAFQEDIEKATRKAVEAEKDYLKELEKLEALQAELADVEDPIKATEKFGRTFKDQFGIVYKELDERGREARDAAIKQISEEITEQRKLVDVTLQSKNSQITALDELQKKVDNYKKTLEDSSTTTTTTTEKVSKETRQNIESFQVDVRQTGIDPVELFEQQLDTIRTLQLDFNQLNESEAARQYDIDRQLLDEKLKYIADTYGEETTLYRNLLEQKQALDDQYNNRRTQLEEQRQIETEFAQLGFEELLLQYQQRQALIDAQLDYVRQKYGEENDIYKALLEQRLQIDKSYQTSKQKLAEAGAKASIDTLAQFTLAFQSQSKVLFEAGKAASVAQAIINTYEGATKALAKYPPPFNAIAAAATIALGLAKVAQIKKQNYQPAAKATGGYIYEKDVLKSAITPPGESGIIGIQTGEFVINRRATAQFLPVLEAINSGRIKRGQISGYQTGGFVAGTPQPQNNFGIDSQVLAGAVQDAIIEGITQSTIRVNGTLSGAGKDLNAVISNYNSLQAKVE